MVARILLLALVGACSIKTGAFEDRRCVSDSECRPDESCTGGYCVQRECTAPEDCGPGYEYSCDEGRCVASACTSGDQCPLGTDCVDGFCATACTGADADSDGICDPVDNCVNAPNRNQVDADNDLQGDACDGCPNDAENDGDSDTVCGDVDNCEFVANTDQLNSDADAQGNECDPDDDNDGRIDTLDTQDLDPNVCGDSDSDQCDDCTSATYNPAADGADLDTDGLCNVGDPDDDNDTIADASDLCAAGATGWTSSTSIDNDGDGCRDADEDTDDDNDGAADGADTNATDPKLCGDSDSDMCDDCAVGTDGFGPMADALPLADGSDIDMQGDCDFSDPDDDNDGVLDADDIDPANNKACGDDDADQCDDCAIGVDGFGPMADAVPAGDGVDTDMQGDCDLSDTDDDNDGIADGVDVAPLDPRKCADSDGDTCDDCAVGTDQLGPLADSLPANDGPDADGVDGCDAIDPDDDNDGIADGMDVASSDPDLCGDSDMDLCDDCAVGTDDFGPQSDATPANDGSNIDGDSQCDAGDADDDNDGVADATDAEPVSPDLCGDADGDSCDDCSVGTDDFGPLADNAPANDGADYESDGLCDVGDTDDDNDARADAADTCPTGVMMWTSTSATDVDRDGCRDSDEDCNTCAPTCGTTCAQTDGDGVADCLEQFCGSDPNSASSTCVMATDQASLAAAITTATQNSTRDFIMINGSFTIAVAMPSIGGTLGVEIHQCVGDTLTFNEGTGVDANATVFTLNGSNSVIDGLTLRGIDDASIAVQMSGTNNILRNSSIGGFERNGVMITNAGNEVSNNVFHGGTTTTQTSSAAAVLISGNNADNVRVVSNLIVDNAADGIRLFDGDSPVIDHNTIAFNEGDAIEIDANNTISTMCIRNNLLTHNAGAAIEIENNNFTWSSTCDDTLSGSPPQYGNAQVGNGTACAGSDCGSCSCLSAAPINGAQNFFEHVLDPAFTYVSTTVAEEDAYCIAAPALIDSADNVDGNLVASGVQLLDLNGREAGRIVGDAGDIGGREAGAEGCPLP